MIFDFRFLIDFRSPINNQKSSINNRRVRDAASLKGPQRTGGI